MHKKSAEAQSPAMERVGHESNRGSNDGNQSRSWSRTQCQHSRVADLKLSVTEGPLRRRADAQEICRSSKSCHGKGYNLRHLLAINPWSNITRSVTSSPRVASQWDMNQIEDQMMVINQDHGHELNVSILGLRIRSLVPLETLLVEELLLVQSADAQSPTMENGRQIRHLLYT
ncbi:hypothetical protein TNCV_1404351 [Trichonephila clavipes]|nr:hypothetical protein TNCV_1404351 [Trichonephila clavipes]